MVWVLLVAGGLVVETSVIVGLGLSATGECDAEEPGAPTAPPRRGRWGALAAAGVLLLAGCGEGNDAETEQEVPDTAGVDGTVGQISLDDVFLEAGDSIQVGASVPLRGALTNNDPEDDDRLVAVTLAAAQSVQLLDDAGQPSPDGIELPAGAEVDGVTGPVRMQVEGVTQPIASVDTVPVTFTFQRAGEVTLDVSVASGPGQGG